VDAPGSSMLVLVCQCGNVGSHVLFLCLQVETIRAVLKKELDLPIIEIGDDSAKLDGGDVLFTGTVHIGSL
jgi:hypothetical protein